jgi:prophage regulatory protein
MASHKHHATNKRPVTPTRPIPQTPMERAKRIADDLDGMREQAEWNGALLSRFGDAGPSSVIKMWEAGKNEKGEPLSKFEVQALVERWCQVFGFLPPNDGAQTSCNQAEPEPADDTMLGVREVERLTGLSESTIERRVKQGLFPKPTKLSARRIGWRAGAVKDWVDERDPNRH